MAGDFAGVFAGEVAGGFAGRETRRLASSGACRRARVLASAATTTPFACGAARFIARNGAGCAAGIFVVEGCGFLRWFLWPLGVAQSDIKIEMVNSCFGGGLRQLPNHAGQADYCQRANGDPGDSLLFGGFASFVGGWDNLRRSPAGSIALGNRGGRSLGTGVCLRADSLNGVS